MGTQRLPHEVHSSRQHPLSELWAQLDTCALAIMLLAMCSQVLALGSACSAVPVGWSCSLLVRPTALCLSRPSHSSWCPAVQRHWSSLQCAVVLGASPHAPSAVHPPPSSSPAASSRGSQRISRQP